jgi:hypothetical protein
MSRFACLSLVCCLACTGGPTDSRSSSNTPLPDFTDHLGNDIQIRSGFAATYDDGGQTARYVVLTNMTDGCASLSWWLDRESELSERFLADPFDEAGFIEALDNTTAVWADEMSTATPWYVLIDVGVQNEGIEVVLPGATRSSEWGDAVFWGTALSLLAPTYSSTADGASRTWGSDGYEASNNAGTGAFWFQDGGAQGSLQSTFETEELAQFDVAVDFDVPACPLVF